MSQVRNNLISNIIALIANIFVGLYYTPYLVNHLGIIAYGVIPLAMLINQYITIVTNALTSSFSRFYSVALQQNKNEEASSNISTSFFVVLLFVVFCFPFLIFFVCKINSFFEIPSQLLIEAKVLFAYTLGSFFISLFSSLLNETLYAQNRLDWLNVIRIFRIVAKLLLLIVFFENFEVNLIYVGLTNFLSELIILIASSILFIRYKPNAVKIRLALFDSTIFKVVGTMTIWVMIQSIGDATLYKIDNIVVNNHFGIVNSGSLGAVSDFGHYVMMIVTVVGSLFGPLILIAYSRNNHKEVVNLSLTQSKLVGVFTAVLAGTLAGYSIPLLNIWLGNNFGKYSIWMILKLSYIPFYAAGGILAYVYRSWNRVKLPAIATVVLGVSNLFVVNEVASLFCSFHYVIELVLLICSVFGILQSYILNYFCVAKIYSLSFKKGIIIFGEIALTFSLTSFICNQFSDFILVKNLLQLIIVIVFSSFIFLLFVYFLFFNKFERKNIISIILKR